MVEYLGMGGSVALKPSIVGYISATTGALLAVAVSPDTLPVMGAAVGVGIGIAWAIVGSNRDRANESLTKQIALLQNMLEAKDAQIKARDDERALVRQARVELEAANERLSVRIARLEEERRNVASGTEEPG